MRTFDYLNIGSTPSEETCLPVNHQDARKEVQRFVDQIFKAYPPVWGASVRVKAFDHDFGTYYEAVVYYDTDNEDAQKYAYMVEADPLQKLNKWTDTESEPAQFTINDLY